jgi:hypothetical protein
MSIQRTPNEVAQYIENFLTGKGGAWDWDDFTSVPITNPNLEAIRIKCGEVSFTHPSTQGHWCNQAGLEILRDLAAKLRVPK